MLKLRNECHNVDLQMYGAPLKQKAVFTCTVMILRPSHGKGVVLLKLKIFQAQCMESLCVIFNTYSLLKL